MTAINYDKSRLINKKPESLLATIKLANGREFCAIKYMPMDNTIIYSDKDISIEKIGKLYYKSLKALVDYVTKYKITKGNMRYEVYSTILADDMRDDELYRQAVIEGLLGNDNIELSNCHGYIGKISRNSENEENSYNVNSKYCLSANEIEVTVVVEYTKMRDKFKENDRERDD